MSARIDRIYDRLIAEEKLKDGTKSERLVAIAFGVLTGRATGHDLRLRGASGVRHQIDAVVGDEHKRILVETKDYDKVIGLPIIRNFWGAVEDIGPDEAFVVTTVGHQAGDPVRRGEGHPPCAAASAEEEDWTGVVRKVVLNITMTGQAGRANVTRQLHPDATTRPTARTWGSESPSPHSVQLADADGTNATSSQSSTPSSPRTTARCRSEALRTRCSKILRYRGRR